MLSNNLPERPETGRTLMLGLVVILTFFGTFLSWSILSPLESAAIAVGEVGTVGKQKVIQHLEGGIVSKILVKDGDIVASGQVLVRLDETQPQANLNLIRGRYHAALALQARLVAERDGLQEIAFPSPLQQSNDENVTVIVRGQGNIIVSRRTALDKKRGILQQRISQYQAEIKGLRQAIHSQRRQLTLTQEEVDAYQHLETNGMSAGKTRMLQLKKEYARIKGEKSKNLAAIARTEQNIGETELRISTLNTQFLNEVIEELREVENEVFDLDEKLRAATDVVERIEIRAPLAGTIVGLQIFTEGGIIGPGEQILGIVPSDEQLIIEARIAPNDIDIVRPGLPAHVRYTAFSSRTHAPVEGKVINVSADRFTDERTGEAYYKAEVELTGDIDIALNGESLYQGMQAEVMIVTGSRTPMDYLLEPLTESLNRAFRE
ncbi:HlyD family type I secretion periplasmic adaptor subunit [Amphritea balenae]|uniref:Membrane fusion protein (MFP) family protein n=1 Tax=Amphritea balenae TaxID=452629 RepID=A0A3P1SWM0_9GAMM|nr:HlyD family type I secretion periplasmic adaptor subunit [Amphritea balenae]RRD00513.1 HlyD family type I secretion periplasmic adaptor subunit [Amphritea balenae]GGK70096.1 HlyD family type I secretion periplasmic adaptor subunit [Amphritea balenae]